MHIVSIWCMFAAVHPYSGEILPFGPVLRHLTRLTPEWTGLLTEPKGERSSTHLRSPLSCLASSVRLQGERAHPTKKLQQRLSVENETVAANMKRALSSPHLSRSVTLKRTRRHRDRCRQRQKNQRTLRSNHVAILCTDGITQSLLQFLETEAIEAVVMTIKASLESSGNTHGVLWDKAFWSSLLKLHCGDLVPVWRGSEKRRVQLPIVVRSRESGACEALLQFVAWTHEREWFDHHVEIIMGDASRMDPVSGAKHGEVVIGSTSYKTGLLSIMGDDLEWGQSSEFQPELSVYAFNRGSQNAFTVFRRNTRARSLIHFIDPSAAMAAPWEALCRSFGAAVDVIEREDLRNVAMMTQSRCTGASLTTAALTGLREIQRYLMTRTWNGTVGVVCYDKESFQTFKAQKEKILKCFGDFR